MTKGLLEDQKANLLSAKILLVNSLKFEIQF